jgi:hypothetical protein
MKERHDTMKWMLGLVAGVMVLGMATSASASFVLNEDFADPAWRHPTDQLFSSPNYPLMVSANGWTVGQGLGLPSGAAIKLRTDVLQYVNSFWENGSQSPTGGNPMELSRADLPELVTGSFSFGWRDGFGSHTNFEVQLKDASGNVAATIRHGWDTTIGNLTKVNGVDATTSVDSYLANGTQPAFITVNWDIPGDAVTLSVLDGPGGPDKSLGLVSTIQNGAGPITQFVLTSGNEGRETFLGSGITGGGGIEMVGSILGGQNDWGPGIANGLTITGVPIPEPASLFLLGAGGLLLLRLRRSRRD